jgi:protein MpaA
MLYMLIMFGHINRQRNYHAGGKIAVIAVILAFLVLSGCYQSPGVPQLGTENKVVVPPLQHFAGVSVENRPIMYYVLGKGDNVTFIMSTIHGDEPAGVSLTNHLADYLNQHPDMLIGRKVVIVPVANPDGLAAKKRLNANGIDLNRNFPSGNRPNNMTESIDSSSQSSLRSINAKDVNGISQSKKDAATLRKEMGPSALSEPEAHIINELVKQYKPNRIVSIHQPYGCIDYDGPAESLAKQMASYCDLPVQKVGAQPGSLGSYAGLTLGIPIITFEMLENDSNLNPELLWQKYYKSLLAAIMYPDPVQ